MEARIEKIIIETLKELNEELENDSFINPNNIVGKSITVPVLKEKGFLV
mgnify:CR=1 FL=1